MDDAVIFRGKHKGISKVSQQLSGDLSRAC